MSVTSIRPDTAGTSPRAHVSRVGSVKVAVWLWIGYGGFGWGVVEVDAPSGGLAEVDAP